MVANFTAALVSLDGQLVPDWAMRRLSDSGVDLVARECVTKAELIEHAADADVVWVFGGSRIVTADCLPLLPRCLALLRTGTGTDNLPLADATVAGIVVAITPEAGGDAVAEHAAALMLAVLRQIASQDRLVRNGVWERDRAWPQGNLTGQTVGLIGFGSIARALVQMLSGFDVSVVVCDPFVSDELCDEYGVVRRSLHDVLSTAQIISLHCPLNLETYHLLGEPEFRAMREDGILINTARGPIVDEVALYHALSNGWIRAAGLDVLESEPPDPANPLLQLENVIITPHIAAYSNTFYFESWRLSVETVIDLASGRWPRACANPEVTPRRPLSAAQGDGSVHIPVPPVRETSSS